MPVGYCGLQLLNDAGMHSEVLRRYYSQKFASSPLVLNQVNAALAMTAGGSHHGHHAAHGGHGGGAAGAGDLGAAASLSRGATPDDPLHVMVSQRPSALQSISRLLSIGFIIGEAAFSRRVLVFVLE